MSEEPLEFRWGFERQTALVAFLMGMIGMPPLPGFLAKFALVLAMSGVHGILSKYVREFAADRRRTALAPRRRGPTLDAGRRPVVAARGPDLALTFKDNRKMKHYGFFRSSASYRLRIGTNLKGLAVDYVPVHLSKNGGEQHLPDFVKLNPQHLVPVLDDFVEQRLSIHAVYPTARHLSPKVRAFVDFLSDWFGARPYWDESKEDMVGT